MLIVLATLKIKNNSDLFDKILLFNQKEENYLELDNLSRNKLETIYYFVGVNVDVNSDVSFSDIDNYREYTKRVINNGQRRKIFPEEFEILFEYFKSGIEPINMYKNGSYDYNDEIEIIEWKNNVKTIIFDRKKEHLRLDLDENKEVGFFSEDQKVLEHFEKYYKLAKK